MSTCARPGHPPNALIIYIACRARDSSEKCRREICAEWTPVLAVCCPSAEDSLLQLSGKGDAEGECLRSQIDRLMLKKEQINTERLNIQESIGRAAEMMSSVSTAFPAHCSIGSLIKTRRSLGSRLTISSCRCGQSYRGTKILSP